MEQVQMIGNQGSAWSQHASHLVDRFLVVWHIPQVVNNMILSKQRSENGKLVISASTT